MSPSITTTTFLTALLLLSSTLAHPATADHSDHDHVARGEDVPAVMRGRKWMQDERSETARMFLERRGPVVGSHDWIRSYPAADGTSPNGAMTPKAWTDRYNALAANSNFPSSYQNSNLNGGYPTYPNGLTGTSPEVCSFTYQCSEANDLLNPDAGKLAIAFDDGPTANSHILYDFIEQNNISATHFMIGANILYQTDVVQRAVKAGGHIAVHTWSHPYMTTMTNAQVVAELGWTMQIIADVTGFVPAFWRPPFGDVDSRVRYIAAEVFGLYTVPWNQDSSDWAITHNPAYTLESVEAKMGTLLAGPKTVGLNILEHELNPNTIGVFTAIYPKMISNNWEVANVADTWGMDWYQNAADDFVTPGNMSAIVQTAPVGPLATYYDSNLSYNDTTNAIASVPAVANTTTSVMANSTTMVTSSGSGASSTSARSTVATTTIGNATTSRTTSVSTAAASAARTDVANAASGAVSEAATGMMALVMIGCGAVMGTMMAL